jgi:hypothetical protein
MASRYYTKRLVTKRPKKGKKMPARPKAFKTEKAAAEWAKKNMLKGSIVEKITESKFKIRRKA